MNDVLMVAYHYPPIQSSSGVHRTLSFSRYLPEHGWRATVLTVSRNALMHWLPKNEAMIPAGVDVIRAWALDTIQHLSIRGKYPGRLAVPDRWITWLVPAVVAGMARILRRRPDVLFSTYPIATAHVIACVLHRLSGIPWVADFRDPMAQDDYPTDARTWRSYRRIEALAVRHAAEIVFATPGALAYYRSRYGDALNGRGIVIENGYEEGMFDGVPASRDAARPADAKLRLLHSGVIYPEERDPTHLFRALRRLKDDGIISAGTFRLVLRSTGHDALYAPDIARLGIGDVVELAPAVDYHAAVREMCECDALLVLQSEGCNFQIPAKVYEYFRADRPIIGLTHPDGDTAELLRRAGVDWIAPLDVDDAIAATLKTAIAALRRRDRTATVYDEAFVASCSRASKSAQLARELDRVIATKA